MTCGSTDDVSGPDNSESDDDVRRAHEKWRKWIYHVRDEVQGLLQGDEYFRLSMKVLREAGRPGNPAYWWLVTTYGRDAAISLRRLYDTTTKVDSLKRLLLDIRAHCRLLSREAFVDAYCTGLPGGVASNRETASKTFTRLIEGPHDHLSKGLVTMDLKKLEDAFASPGYEKVINLRIAHSRPRVQLDAEPLWQDLHDAIQVFHRVCWRYLFLLHQEDRGGQAIWQPHPEQESWVREILLGEE